MSPDTVPDPAPASARMPALDVSTHVFSDDPELRAVTINGRRFVVDDVVAPDVRLVEITETGIVVDYRGARIAVDVLQDWR
ncbi:MAG: general secretion pathway protein GspB [Gammaproteobacteria bacterium]|nr:general secretion pathway protein GspB [Gammaproteobacteria bacterium]